ncbi:MAG: DUF4145 domain-containing protein [Vampirovibrionales bacterium]
MDSSSQKKYVEPRYDKHTFTCQHCGAITLHLPQKYDQLNGFHEHEYSLGTDYTKVESRLTYADTSIREDKVKTLKVFVSSCCACKGIHFFVEEVIQPQFVTETETFLVYPFKINYKEHEAPCEDMPENIRALYNEASQVLEVSPRCASALLRCALEQLLKVVVTEEARSKLKTLDNYIEKFIEENPWAEQYKPHFTELRTIGNDALHNPYMDFFKDKAQAKQDCLQLFDFLNLIVFEMYTRKKRHGQLFEKRNTEAKIKQRKPSK